MIRDFIVAALLLIAIVVVSSIILIYRADGRPQCMSYGEARAQWPTKHLYWSTKNRCWHDGRHHRLTPFETRQHYAAVSTPKTDADFCCWPDLPRDANGAIIEPPKPFADRWMQTLDVWRY